MSRPFWRVLPQMSAFFPTKKMMTGAGWKGHALLLPLIFAGVIEKGFIDTFVRRGAGRIKKMPIYEYQCLTCEKESQQLVLKKEEEEALFCPGCGSSDLKKLISRVAYHVSENDRLDAFNPRARQDDSFFKDSRNIGLSAKKRAKELGVDLGGGFEAKLDKLRTDPGSVLKDSE